MEYKNEKEIRQIIKMYMENISIPEYWMNIDNLISEIKLSSQIEPFSYMLFPDDRSRLYAALRCIEAEIESGNCRRNIIKNILTECKRPLKAEGD